MIEIGKIYKSQEAAKLTNLMDNFKLEEHSLPKSKHKPKSLKNKKVNRSFTIYNISKYLNCKELNNEGRYRASNHRNAAIKAFINKTKNKEGPIKNYITINEPASGIVKTFQISRDSMLKLNIETVETPSNCVRNLLKTKYKRKSKSKKQSKKNN